MMGTEEKAVAKQLVEAGEGVGCGKMGAGDFFPHGVNKLPLATRPPRVPTLCGADKRSQVAGRRLVLRYLRTTAPPPPQARDWSPHGLGSRRRGVQLPCALSLHGHVT